MFLATGIMDHSNTAVRNKSNRMIPVFNLTSGAGRFAARLSKYWFYPDEHIGPPYTSVPPPRRNLSIPVIRTGQINTVQQ